ncbi:sugar-binding domain-containing protein [Parapedobacter pyrenivorans]|uniref:sugar-binding domain-containing protein n=1 Tax=Parapedobacter pyrenivorans TaxID=1305674 RepID=UPI0033417351
MTIKKVPFLTTFILLVVGAMQLIYGQSAEQATLLNDDWKFHRGDLENAADIATDDAKWQAIQLPHDWSVESPLSPTLASATGYLPGGIGWYRKHLTVPETPNGKTYHIYFEGVYNRSEVFINGISLGKRPNGYISFQYDLTPYLRYGEDNVLAVRVDHSQDADSRWYTGSGIYRNVWLVPAEPVHLEQWGVYAYPTLDKRTGTLHVQVALANTSTSPANVSIQTALTDPTGKTVAKKTTSASVPAGDRNEIQLALDVKAPRLWSLDNPTQYTLETVVLQAGKPIDRSTVKTGFRTFTFDPDKGFALNGEWMKVKGVCIHHDAGVLGAAMYPEVWRRRLLTLKKLGVNAIRTSHNPQATSLYALCDELGLLVMNEAYDEWEFPKRKWLEGWNVGTPGFQGAYDFFAEWGERDLADLVKRDRNHLSIFAWSIGNEVDYPNDPYSHPILDGGHREGGFTQATFGGYKPDAPDAMRLGDIAKRLTAVVKQYDTSRPVTAGLAGVAMSNETAYPNALDIAGYNYTESRYEEDHKRYPKRVIYGSENRHDLAAWKAVRDNEYIFGQFLWTGIDYLGESGRWPSRGFYSGLLDFGGFIKPRGYYRQSLWADEPMVYIGTYPRHGRGSPQRASVDAWPVWNYTAGDTIRVVSYTNCDAVKLYLDGQPVTAETGFDTANGIYYWDIPYQPGKLEAVGLRGGAEAARYAIQTSSRPARLIATVERQRLTRNREVAHVTIEVVDAAGVPVALADDNINVEIDGPAQLLGLEGSNNTDMSDYTDATHRAYRGRLLAYLVTTGQAGAITVTCSAPWLSTVQVTLEAE